MSKNQPITPRINRMRERYFETRPELCVERDILYTESFKKSVLDRMEIRRAKAFKHVMDNIPIAIQDDELIVGSPNPKIKATACYPEIGAEWMIKDLDTFEARKQDPLIVSPETKKILKEELFPYWADKNLSSICLNSMPDVPKELILLGELYIYWYENAPGHTAPAYASLIAKGIEGVKADAQRTLAKLSRGKYKDLRKIDFLNAIIIVCDGMINYGKRYAQKAREMASMEKDAQRRAELIEIADICERIPAKPAQTFRDVLQFVNFMQVLNYVESKNLSCMVGRLDQYAYPYYQKDIQSGRITKDEAQELLECLWIKIAEIIHFNSNMSAHFGPGYMSYQVLSIGGLDRDGNDAVNDLSYMCLRATADVRLNQPPLVALFSEKSPKEFYDAVCDTLAAGTGGIPALISVENGMETLLQEEHCTIEEARMAGAYGCVQYHFLGQGTSVEGGISNLAADLERTLHNGFSPLSGRQIGPKTGNPREFTSYEQLLDALKAQIGHMQDQLSIATLDIWRHQEEDFPLHFESIVTEGCVDSAVRAKAPHAVGPKYPCFVTILPSGLPTVADSLAAIKKLVFDEKKITMSQLLDALDANFEGYEDLRQMLINEAPKYGNDDDYVDSIAVDLQNWLHDYTKKYTSEEGHRVGNNYNLINSNVPMGMCVGATPDGRKAKMPLANNLSPTNGADKSGPTAVFKTVSKYDPIMKGQTLLNLKFQPDVLQGENREKFISLLKTYFKIGGYHVQINFLDAKTLYDAQKHPEKHRDLLVRIAGFSAYFTQLAKETQDDIIKRTTQAI